MYLVFTTNWGDKKKRKFKLFNYLIIRNNNKNVYGVKICSMYIVH